jgi:hypothetical protein
MKTLLSLLLLVASHAAFAQPKDAVLNGLKGKVKQVKINHYKLDLSDAEREDSVLIGTDVLNYDENGNLLNEEIKHLKTDLVIKKVYRYNPKQVNIGYDVFINDVLTTTSTRVYKDDYVIQEESTTIDDKKTRTTVTSIYNPDYRLKKVSLTPTLYDEYVYDDKDDAFRVTRTEFDETTDVTAYHVTKRDSHGNPLRVLSVTLRNLVHPLTREMTYTYY